MKHRRPSFIRPPQQARVDLTAADLAVIVGALLIILGTILIVAIAAASSAPRPTTLGPERSDRAYCWYTSDPCSARDQLVTK